jgi:hypothetical protein
MQPVVPVSATEWTIRPGQGVRFISSRVTQMPLGLDVVQIQGIGVGLIRVGLRVSEEKHISALLKSGDDVKTQAGNIHELDKATLR